MGFQNSSPKNGIPFLVGITKIEHLVFSCKTTCNAKTNRMGSTKYTYHKERGFVLFFVFFENFVSM